MFLLKYQRNNCFLNLKKKNRFLKRRINIFSKDILNLWLKGKISFTWLQEQKLRLRFNQRVECNRPRKEQQGHVLPFTVPASLLVPGFRDLVCLTLIPAPEGGNKVEGWGEGRGGAQTPGPAGAGPEIHTWVMEVREGLCSKQPTVSSSCPSSPAAPRLQPIAAISQWGPGATRSSPFVLEASNLIFFFF